MIETIFGPNDCTDEKLTKLTEFLDSNKITKDYFNQAALKIAKEYSSDKNYNKAAEVLELINKN